MSELKSTLAPPPVDTSNESLKNDITVPVAKPDTMSKVGGIPKTLADERASESQEISELGESSCNISILQR